MTRPTEHAHDVAIVGLGAMGSAAAYQLSKRGRKVIAFDMLHPPHSAGSTHGESRIIREAYFEGPLYVPLVQRSYECWNALETDSGEHLLLQTGGLLLGPENGSLVGGTRLSADRHGLDYQILRARHIRKQYPVFRAGDDTVGLWEPRAGVLFPEKCVEAHLSLAVKNGADVHFDEPVREWRPDADGVRVTTDGGQYTASKLLLAPGAWMGHFLPDLNLPLAIERQVLYWFEPAEHREKFEVGALPVFAWEYSERSLFYGFPNLGGGVKLALHHQGAITDIDSIDRTVSEDEIEAMRLLIRVFIPALDGPVLRTEVCMYTNTPDEHFLIDFHPRLPQVLIASPCSGHGFKFAAVIGEILADLLVDGKSQFDLSPFSVRRLTTGEE